jgi:uncharacterized protein (TIGR02266 family)
MADARKDRRTLLSLRIRYKSATLEDFIERYSMDISGGGVFIKAKKPLAVGTLLKFEFMLQDQSSLIHGVGRVAWRREEAEASEGNPPGMGIKFIKMDPESRAIVQRIVDERARPGVFDRGKEGLSEWPRAVLAGPGDSADSTKVQHVSEFLASAFEEGGAGETATREARVGLERAQRSSARAGSVVGAFGKPTDRGPGRASSDAPGRGAMSAFGGSSVTLGGGVQSSAAPAMDELDDDDDFADNETTKVQQVPASDLPLGDADATVVAAESPFAGERRQTPVVPARSEPASPLETEVPDLFGPDSFGPAPAEVIDASLLDPGVVTVPPKASALPRGAMPQSTGIPSEAFRVPQAPAPVGAEPPTVEEPKGSRAGLVLALLLLLLAGGGVAAWQLGFLEPVFEAIPSLIGSMEAPVVKAPPVVSATPTPEAPAAEEAPSDPAQAGDDEAPADVAKGAEAAAVPADPRQAPTQSGLVKLRVVSIPSGAFVSVNGKGAGRTPLQVEYETGTELSLFAKARGFLARRQQVTVDAAEPEVKLMLSPLPYVVEVVTDPPGARASAVGGGEITTPGTLNFRSMPSSRNIVVSKDGYETASTSISRASFIEEKSRMTASVRVTLAKQAGAAPVEAPEPPSSAVSVEPEDVQEQEPALVASPSEPEIGADVP